ncbi:carbon storage regulator [Legionella fairfieldensis]|uniref:carbon storage regulator n=1 Tax=Legionella fairfieldensis TaxID=45064 RepID=UPI00048A6E39|nr:carbon storage regulator [Legionella fairfieldensis]
MLQLGTGEKIRISNEIELTVLEIKGKQVRLGFLAPHHIEIYREEIYLRIKNETEELKLSIVG